MSHSRLNRGAGRRRALAPSGTKKALPQVYLKGGEKILPEIYMTDHGTQRGSMFKWIVSTMLAGIVGIGAIGTVIYASLKSDERIGPGDMVSELRDIGAKALTPFKPLLVNRQIGPRFAISKSDRMVVTSKGLSTRHIIHDTFAREKDRRQYVSIKPYVRVVSALATARPDDNNDIPAFDPLKLYANLSPVGGNGAEAEATPRYEAKTTTLKLPQLIVADDEAYVLPDDAVQALIVSAAEDERADVAAELASVDIPPAPREAIVQTERNTTTVARTPTGMLTEDDGNEIHEATVRQGDSVATLMQDAGVDPSHTRQIIAAMNRVYAVAKIKAGQKLRYALAPRTEETGKTEPVELALYEGDRQIVAVSRSEDGEYVAESEPDNVNLPTRSSDYPSRATLYQSFYQSALLQDLPPGSIMKLLRIHAYDTDLKRPTLPGDAFEAFFDTAAESDLRDTRPDELLFTSIVIDGEKREFFRFRTPDGRIDYYDRDGNSAKKFLMRKPVRGDRVRLASGFGYRMHPLLKVQKLHTGTDWSGPIGTPVLAAGNGTIEFIGTRGTYGNYVRIRHANGYKTAYAHLNGFADGLRDGIQVSQGQVIGYLGNSGRSTGPHLHFEVLVNSNYVDSMTIPVPRGSRLTGHLLAQFIKERDRIDELMSRDPVNTRVASAH